MAVALKAELHRLVEAIPDARPELTAALLEMGLRLIVASRADELLYRRLLRELAEVQASGHDPTELDARVKELQGRWLDELGAPTLPLPSVLESAPIDDEPLTLEEIAMLDARRATAATGSTISDDELGRLLQK
jgi:hypothetical protein